MVYISIKLTLLMRIILILKIFEEKKNVKKIIVFTLMVEVSIDHN